MSSHNCQRALALCGIALSLAACLFAPTGSDTKRVEQQFESFKPPVNAFLLYEHTFSDMGATGACAAVYIDRWYGTAESFDEVQLSYTAQINSGEWKIWPEDVSEIWRKETSEGLYSLIVRGFSNNLNAERASYTIPDDIREQMKTYPTIYLVGLGFMRASEVEQCFGK